MRRRALERFTLLQAQRSLATTRCFEIGGLSFADFSDSDDRIYMNPQYADGTLQWADVPRLRGLYYYDATAMQWMTETEIRGGAGADDQTAAEVATNTGQFGGLIPRTADTVQKALDAVDNVRIPDAAYQQLFDGSGPGRFVSASTVSLVNSNALTIDPPGDDTTFDISANTGTADVSVRLTITSPSDTGISFVSSSATTASTDDQSTVIKGIAHASRIAAAQAYASANANGVEIGEASVYRRTLEIGRGEGVLGKEFCECLGVLHAVDGLADYIVFIDGDHAERYHRLSAH